MNGKQPKAPYCGVRVIDHKAVSREIALKQRKNVRWRQRRKKLMIMVAYHCLIEVQNVYARRKQKA